MALRSVLGLIFTIKNLQEMGLDCATILKAEHFDPNHIDPGAMIDRATELRILSRLQPLFNDPDLGLTLGSRFGLAGYGPFSMMIMTCPNAYEACRIGVKYQQITYLRGRLSLAIERQRPTLTIHYPKLPDHIEKFLIDNDLSGTLRFIRDLAQGMNSLFEVVEIAFPYPKPDRTLAYERLSPCPVRFGHPHAAISFNPESLKQPFTQANGVAFELYKAQCDQLMMQSNLPNQALPSQVTGYLNLFANSLPSAGDVANSLGMSERTLRRQLSAHGTRYQKLLDDVRFAKARHWLSQSNCPIEDIAERLGYSEAASFNHAFLRWSGVTPSHYRRSA